MLTIYRGSLIHKMEEVFFVTQKAVVWNFLGEIYTVHENLDVLDKTQNGNLSHTRQNDHHLN